MNILDLSNGKNLSARLEDLDILKEKNCFIMCSPMEIVSLQPVFGFDDTTITECLNYDENIRFTSYVDYDFISFLYFNIVDTELALYEINVFVGKKFVILVFPSNVDGRIKYVFEEYLSKKIMPLVGTNDCVVKAYFYVFDKILWDFSNELEILEDMIQELEKSIIKKGSEELLYKAYKYKEIMHLIKKIFRALLYIGDQFIVNENEIILPGALKFFKNLDVRINKLYDFAVSLQEYSNHVINLYDSKLAMETNRVVNKLTLVTIFFGPPTIIAGIYGMNFTHMPELNWLLGYPLSICFMIAVTASVYVILKLKKWI